MWSLKFKFQYRSIRESRSTLNHRIRFSAIYAIATVNHFEQTEVQRKTSHPIEITFLALFTHSFVLTTTRQVVRFVKTNSCVNNVDQYCFHGVISDSVLVF